MAEIIIAISMWCGTIGNTTSIMDKEMKECRKVIFKCVRHKVTCSSCWSIMIPSSVYDSALSLCIEEREGL